ncbi:MAG: translation initiation factor [Zetaproteobacteria bacterium]|nr:translation initiation factor [Zetaproteobacteria bacterium]
MNNDRRLVYSSEDGQIGKTMPNTRKKRKIPQKSPSQGIKNPAKQGVRIRRESKGRGGKSVCVIEGLSLNTLELKALHKKLKAQLGTGGAVKGGCIEIQGDHREKLLVLLEKEGVKAKLAGG